MTTHAATAHAPMAAPHQEGMSRGMAGMVLFIASEIMLFGGLFAGYFYIRSQAQVWPPVEVEHTPDAVVGGILTAVLITSGFAAHGGLVALQSGKWFGILATGARRGMILGTLAAIILGTIFIAGQAYEWLSLMHEGFTAKNTAFGSAFYILTGFHGAHVIAGLAMLAVVLVRTMWGDFTARRHLFAETALMYWHFVDVVWVILFVILYIS